MGQWVSGFYMHGLEKWVGACGSDEGRVSEIQIFVAAVLVGDMVCAVHACACERLNQTGGLTTKM